MGRFEGDLKLTMSIANQVEQVSRRLARVEARLVKLADSLGVDVSALTNVEFEESNEVGIAAIAHVPSLTSSLHAVLAACKQKQLRGTVEVCVDGTHIADLYI